ncbi:tyrosine-type recombinase/integrase [Bradyrhizobium sp. USDA 223]|uniref:tyrosine-type recombinase/integrase n=1 Tax=Bradyrhizobium sp. USDA 223 TaxID=3156306 RepID=UPI0038349A36
MALRMVALNRAADGRWFARKGIPEDVREDYQRLYGHKREAHLKLAADTPKYEAKARLGEWEAEIETRIATLRAQRNGEGQPLTKLNAIALAGRWYNWFVKQHEADPGKPKYWRDLSDYVVWNVIRPEAPEEYEVDPQADPRWEWAKEPEVREAVRPQIAEVARVATFLASEGKSLNSTAYALFVDAVSDNLLVAFSLLEKRANGDYSHDDTPDTFPPFTDGPVRASGLGCWDLFEAFVVATKPADTTVQRWRAVFLEMQRQFVDIGANGITEDAARSWVRGLVSEERSALTVREVWLSASRRVFAWGLEHKHLHRNPFATIKVDVPRKAQTRETGKAFTPEEARTILKAALAIESPRTPSERAKRWVPWLCAYSGARPGEITQLRGSDIEQRGRFYVMKLTPDAGTIKTRQMRVVPIHQHIIDQGFLEMVREVGKGALFYNDRAPQRARKVDPLKPSRARAATTRAHLGEWVRSIGVTDTELSPNHAWRHTFKQIADRVGISEKVHDAITGHAPASEGRRYGAPTVEDMAKALKRFPRYKL